MRKIPVFAMGALLVLARSGAAWGDGGADPGVQSLEDMESYLAGLKTLVASKKEATVRETPGIVTVITGDEIARSGARDLIDVLQRVPGLEFGQDVEGVVGLGVRGLWAHEGKVLLLWDGLPMNEMLFTNLNFGNHYPVSQISRVEIIRGPGSAVYGGYAELAVINVITRSAGEINGLEGTVVYGQGGSDFARRNASLSFGRRYGEDLSVTAHFFLGQGHRTEGALTDETGTSYSLKGGQRLDPMMVNLGVKYGASETRLLVDRFATTDQVGFDASLAESTPMSFTSYYASTKYEFRPAEGLRLIPSLTLSSQTPWNSVGPAAVGTSVYYDKTVNRYSLGVLADYALSSQVDLLGGVDVTMDRAFNRNPNPPANDFREMAYSNRAVYGQGIVRTGLADITAGARLEQHNRYASQFVPRLAATRVFGDLHAKALASKAFRAPSLENMNKNPSIRPENTTVYEIELGYKLAPSHFVTGNFFDITMMDPIVYILNLDAYENFARTGSRGFELEYRFKDSWASSTLSYSYYRSVDNQVSLYDAGMSGSVLGFSNHRLAWNASIELGRKGVTLNPALVFIGTRFGYDYSADVGGLTVRSFNPTWLASLNASYENFLVKDLDASLGVFNLLDTDYRYIQPYGDGTSGKVPLPSGGREAVLKLGYRL